MFKNVLVYRISPGWKQSVQSMEKGLQAARFVPCDKSAERSFGWAEPRGQAHGPLVEAVGGSVVLDETYRGGARFVVELPVASSLGLS